MTIEIDVQAYKIHAHNVSVGVFEDLIRHEINKIVTRHSDKMNEEIQNLAQSVAVRSVVQNPMNGFVDKIVITTP